MFDMMPVFQNLYDSLPDQIIGLCQYNDVVLTHDLSVDPNRALIVVTENHNLHEIREAYQSNNLPPDWKPTMLSEALAPFYFLLRPIVATAIKNGKISGNVLFDLPPIQEEQRNSYFAKQRLVISNLLLAENLPPEIKLDATDMLAQLSAVFDFDRASPVAQRLAQLHAILVPRITPSSESTIDPVADAPDCLPQLRAIYSDLDSALLIVPDESVESILQTTDWQAVLAWMGNFEWIQLLTDTHLMLLAQTEMALDFGIQRYRHHWGHNFLKDVEIPTTSMIMDAARNVIAIAVEILPQYYIRAPENELSFVIHDLQNRLLRIHLQYDLLSMSAALPPHSIAPLYAPSDWPNNHRIDAIRSHLDQWIDYYRQLLTATMA